MKISRRIPTTLIAVAAVVGPALVAEAPPVESLRVEQLKWTRLDTDHFQVHSTTTVERTRNIVTSLEQFRSFLGRLLPGISRKSRRPTHVFIFGSANLMHPYNLRVEEGRPGGAGGFCAPSPFVNYIVIDASPGSLYKTVVYHEYTHYFFDRRYAGFPLWFHEGIAEYFGTYAESEHDLRFGHSQPHHLKWIRDHRWAPMNWIFSLTADSRDYREDDKNGVFYAQSWLLMHYLLHEAGGEGFELSQILELGGAGVPLEQAVLKELSMTDVQLDEALKQYAARKSFSPRSVVRDSNETSAPLEAKPAKMDTVLTRLGELQAFVHADYASAERHLRTALVRNKERADALSSLAFVLDVTGRAEEAQKLHSASAEQAADPWIFIKRGIAGLERLRTEKGEPVESLLTETRQAFATAVKLAPELSTAHSGQGETYRYSSGDGAAGIEVLERALALGPEDDHATIALIDLYARVGRVEESDALLSGLVSENRQRSSILRARQASVMGKQKLAEVLIENQEFDRVIALFESMAENAASPSTRDIMRRNAEMFRGEALRFARIDRYNAAVELINSNQLAAARDALTKLQPEIDDEQLAAAVAQALEEIATRSGQR